MFWPDVIALKEFYSTPLGRIASNAVTRGIRQLWPSVKNECVLGIGFTTPYLASFAAETQSVFACMPAAQGVTHWPPGGKNLTLLSDEAELPFADNSVNRILIVHALENSEQVRQMISETWRVLSPQGRVIAIVPNRHGIWSRSARSPFAFGQPYTSGQLRQVFSEHSFTPLYSRFALFFPPSFQRFILKSSRFLESAGSQFFPGFGGVLMMEAEKQVYAPLLQKIRRQGKKNYLSVAQAAGI